MEPKAPYDPAPGLATVPGGEAPPPYEGPALAPTGASATPFQNPPEPMLGYAAQAKSWIRGARFSHVWFLFWNLGAIALAICVLSGCGSPNTATYSLLAVDGRSLGSIAGATGCKSCEPQRFPDMYLLGLSGVCRVKDGVTACSRQFPFTFNLASTVLQDIGNATTPEQMDAEYKELVSQHSVPHGLVARISSAMGALLIVSAMTGFGSMILALTRTSGFSETLLPALFLDAAIGISCLGLYVSILVYEVFKRYPDATIADTTSNTLVGIGTWLLIAMFGARLVSHPVVLISFLSLCFVLLLLPLCIAFGILMACCCGDRSNPSGSGLHVVHRPSHIVGVIEENEVEIEHRKDGTILARAKSSVAYFSTL